MIALQRSAAGLLAAVALAAGAAPQAPPEAARRTPFTHFGTPAVLALHGDGASASVGFGARSDELVTGATFHLRYSGSASAAAGARLRLELNGEEVALLPLAGGDGAPVVRDVEVDPRLVVGFNRLAITLLAPGDAAATAEVSGASELGIAVRLLKLADDLAMFPEPFFDRHDQRRVTVPFVFAPQPSPSTLRAAAIVASWIGHLAQWRGARFPTELDGARGGHSIAFATNAERPAFLADLPAATGPQLRLVTHPADGRSKLLLVLGRDGEDLAAAARALVRDAHGLSGPAVAVKPGAAPPPRAAYDAPAWVRGDRAVKLGELVASPRQLEVAGRAPALPPVEIDLRAPPDLDPRAAAALSLALRYAPPACVSDAHLDVAVNGEVLDTSILPVGAAAMTHARQVSIPAGRLRGRDRLAIGVRFALQDAAQCRDARAHAASAAVAADSTLDFSGVPHRARLPDLARFAHAGFPFTRFADLSQTVAVLPAQPAAGDIEALLALVARLGEATGHPATRLRIAAAHDDRLLADADLLVVGAATRQPLVARWLDTSLAQRVGDRGLGPLAALYGAESPVSPGRSVVALTAVAPDQMLRMVDALDDPRMRAAIGGGAAFVLPGKVESLPAAHAYIDGEDARARRIAYAALAAALASALAFTAWRWRRRARSRA